MGEAPAVELERIEARLAVLTRADAAHAERFPSWTVTGRGGRSFAKRAQRQAAEAGRTLDRACEVADLSRRAEDLRRRIADAESGGPERRAEAQARRERVLLEWWAGLKPGDTFSVGNGPLTVLRRSAKSVTSTGGVRWSIIEVTGISAKRLKQIEAAAPCGADFSLRGGQPSGSPDPQSETVHDQKLAAVRGQPPRPLTP